MTEVTAQQIEAWKKQYGSVSKLKLASGEVAYVRQPTTQEIEFASVNLMQGKTYTFGITLFRICQLGGDQFDGKDEAKMRGIAQQMTSIIEVTAVEVEKL